VPHSRIKLELVKLLEAEGFLKGHDITTESKFPSIRIHLKYDNRRNPIIHSLKRVSKPGLRVYKGSDALKPLRSGLTTQILSTSQGLMTDREARRKHIGGEVLCEVW
jgi:small subunit ribosomal protein S8